MNSAILEPLLKSPLFVEHVQELNGILADERQGRLKFYEEITEDHKWEFINGQVVMHSPATNQHNQTVARLLMLLRLWVTKQQLGTVTAEKTLCQFPRNDYEPDIVFYGVAKTSLLKPDTLLHPVPDFVVEVLSPSTSANDRGIKLRDYEAHGVGEYWIVDADQQRIEQYIANDGRFTLTQIESPGTIRSQVIRGFEAPAEAVFVDQANLAAIQRLLG